MTRSDSVKINSKAKVKYKNQCILFKSLILMPSQYLKATYLLGSNVSSIWSAYGHVWSAYGHSNMATIFVFSQTTEMGIFYLMFKNHNYF